MWSQSKDPCSDWGFDRIREIQWSSGMEHRRFRRLLTELILGGMPILTEYLNFPTVITEAKDINLP